MDYMAWNETSSAALVTFLSSPATLFGHFFQQSCRVFHFLPYKLADKNRGFLLGGQSDAVARTGVNFQDFALLQFILRSQNQAPEIGSAFEVIDDDTLNRGPQGFENHGHQVMSEGAFLGCAAHKHADGTSDAVIHVDHKSFLGIPQKHSHPVGRWDQPLHLHLNDIIVHPARLPAAKRFRENELPFPFFLSKCQNLLEGIIDRTRRDQHSRPTVSNRGIILNQLTYSMNKVALIETVQKSLGGISKADAERAVNAVIDGIKTGIKKTKSVQLIGFGTFKVASRKARTGVNPKTGAKIKIKASKTVKFVAGKALKGSL